MTFRQKLLQLMEEKGLTVNGLATASGIPFPTVRSYTSKGQNNRLPTFANAVKLASALKVSLDVFKDCSDFTNDEK